MTAVSLNAALNLHRSGRLAEAEAAYRALLSGGDSQAARLLGVLLLQSQRFEDAADLLAPLSAQQPGDVELAVNASLALRRCGRLDEAREAAERAREADSSRVSVWNALGLAAQEAGDFGDALAAFEQGLQRAPGQPALRLHRAQCLRRLGRAAESAAEFSGLAQAQPDLIEAWRGLAAAQSNLGDTHGALASRARALALAPRDRECRLEHAVALLHAGQPAQAAVGIEAVLAEGDEDAEAWTWLGRARLKAGELDAARAAFEQAFVRDPNDPVIAHFHAATRGEVPGEVESDYIRSLFDDFAARFEQTLVGALEYATPRKLADFIHARVGDGFDSVLDLGCGTGLMAVELARPGRDIDGVDLSERMLDIARDKGLYRELHAAEVLEFLRGETRSWPLIVAADVFVYVGELKRVFEAVFDRLPPGGVFAFSIERASGETTELPARTARFRHAPAQLASMLADAGFIDIARDAVDLRLESGQPVAGELMLARRPG
jgi:predicted TPR repeat methyltransferase